MINVKSNGNGKNIMLDNDVEWITPTINENTYIISALDGTIRYNKNIAVFSSALNMKASSMNNGDILLTLPFETFNHVNSFVLGLRKSGSTYNFIDLYVDQNGNLKINQDQEFNQNDVMMIYGSIPLKIGGGFLTFFKKLRAFFLGKEVAYA